MRPVEILRPLSRRARAGGGAAARRAVTATAVVALAVTAGATSASAATTIVFTEKTTSVSFIPSSGSDPRGAGSVLISQGSLSRNGSAVGTVYVICTTTRQVAGDYYGSCDETLVTGNGSLFARGEINESALERYQPQTLQIYAGGGVYGGAHGTLTVQQVVYPDTFTLTAALA